MTNIEYLVGDKVHVIDGASSRDIDAQLRHMGYGNIVINYTTPGVYEWVAPSDGVLSAAVVVGIGCGGDGGEVNDGLDTSGGGGGGGGASARTALTLVAGRAYEIQVPAHGSRASGDSGFAYFKDKVSGTFLMKAQGGANASTGTAGAAGLASASTGDTKFNGGAGSDAFHDQGAGSLNGGGGGGAGTGGAGGASTTAANLSTPATAGAAGAAGAGAEGWRLAGGVGGGPGDAGAAAAPGGGGSGIIDEGSKLGGAGQVRLIFTRR